MFRAQNPDRSIEGGWTHLIGDPEPLSDERFFQGTNRPGRPMDPAKASRLKVARPADGQQISLEVVAGDDLLEIVSALQIH